MKAIKSLEITGILLKRTTGDIISLEGGFIQFSCSVNESQFTINEKRTYTVS